MAFSDDFKKAISNLSSKEKDKLIFRLLRKDELLASRLEFELLALETANDKKGILQESLLKDIKSDANYYKIAGVLFNLKFKSGEITRYAKITKDKIGEIELNLFLMNLVLQENKEKLTKSKQADLEKFCVYVIGKIFKNLVAIRKLDEDYLLEFKEQMQTLGSQFLENDPLMRVTIHHGFDPNWLLSAEIPANIESIEKDLRERGFLKAIRNKWW